MADPGDLLLAGPQATPTTPEIVLDQQCACRHCEERSDEATQRHVMRPLGCFAALAMTGREYARGPGRAGGDRGQQGDAFGLGAQGACMASRRREGVRGEGPTAAIRPSWKRMSTVPDAGPQLTLSHAVQGSSLSF